MSGRGMPGRSIDPRAVVERVVDRRLGVTSQRDERARLDRVSRAQKEPSLIVAVALGPFFRESLGASGDANYSLRLEAPTSASVWAATGTGLDFVAAQAGRVIGAAAWASAALTAGTATVGAVTTTGGTAYLTDAVLSPTQRLVVHVGAWRDGIPFAAGDTVRPVVFTQGLAPTTVVVGVTLYLAYGA